MNLKRLTNKHSKINGAIQKLEHATQAKVKAMRAERVDLYKQALVRYYPENTIKDIAAAFGSSPNAVSSALRELEREHAAGGIEWFYLSCQDRKHAIYREKQKQKDAERGLWEQRAKRSKERVQKALQSEAAKPLLERMNKLGFKTVTLDLE